MKEENPIPGYSYLAAELAKRFPNLAYLHVVEPRVDELLLDIPEDKRHDATKAMSNDFIREIWAPRPLISAGGHTRESAFEFAENGDLVAFGRLFISNVSIFIFIYSGFELTGFFCSLIYPCGSRRTSRSRREIVTHTILRVLRDI